MTTIIKSTAGSAVKTKRTVKSKPVSETVQENTQPVEPATQSSVKKATVKKAAVKKAPARAARSETAKTDDNKPVNKTPSVVKNAPAKNAATKEDKKTEKKTKAQIKALEKAKAKSAKKAKEIAARARKAAEKAAEKAKEMAQKEQKKIEKQHAKIKYDRRMQREEAVTYFTSLIAGIEKGGVQFKQANKSLVLAPSDQVDVEIKAEIKGRKEKVTFEISWVTTNAKDISISSS